MSDLTLGTSVMGTDAAIGRLTGLVCHPTTRQVTHLTLHLGHLFGREDETFPVGEIAATTEDVVRLRSDADGIAGAPTRPCVHH